MKDQTESQPNPNSSGLKLDNNRVVKFSLVLISVLGVLSFSKFGLHHTSRVETPVKILNSYSSNPGANYQKINIRSGPGTEHSVIKEINRGKLVYGIGYQLDVNGERWIQLQNGGYAKETVLKKK